MSIAQVITALLPLVDKIPKDNDVKAGWTAFAVFVGLALAVAVLGVSLTRHLRTAERNLKEPDETPPIPETPATRRADGAPAAEEPSEQG